MGYDVDLFLLSIKQAFKNYIQIKREKFMNIT